MGKQIRLDKYLSELSRGTRSELKTAIRKGKVTVNGVPETEPERKVDPEKDRITFDGEALSYTAMEYYLLNKPAGVVSASKDAKEATVIGLIENRVRKDLFPVGRLDKDTEGLLLITNDGHLAHALLSPKKHVDKVYLAKIKGEMTAGDVKAFAEGLLVDEEFTALPARLEILRNWIEKDICYSMIRLTIREGKFHQVKRMVAAVGKEVISLKRIAMGPLKLPEDLVPGQYRALTEKEVFELKTAARVSVEDEEQAEYL